LCTATNRGSDVLLGSDFDGNIVMWNLSLLKVNPFELSNELTLKGFHETEDPAILCMVYHATSSTFFTGGNDGSLRAFRISDRTLLASYVGFHVDSVNCLACPEDGNVLVSSDMSGVICLWRLSETGQICPVIRWVPSEMSELTGVVVDIDVGKNVNNIKDGNVDAYIARAEKYPSSHGYVLVQRVQVPGEDFHDINGRVSGEARGGMETKDGGELDDKNGVNQRSSFSTIVTLSDFTPALEIPDALMTNGLCTIFFDHTRIDTYAQVTYDEESVDGDGVPSSLNLLSLDDPQLVMPADSESHSHSPAVTAPNTLYVGRTTGAVYRFEI